MGGIWAAGLIRVLLGMSLWLALSVGAQTTAREMVEFEERYRPGSVVIKTGERRLYFILRGHRAVRYPVAVGRQGKAWRGRTRITRKVKNPTWAVPAGVKRDIPWLPDIVPPGPRNPLGVAALPLAVGDYAIHGTNRPSSIGKAVSYGCIRMYNRDISDLFGRVRVGTEVIVLP